MPDAVTSDTLADGDRNLIMHFTNLSDSTGEAAVTKVDVSALNAHSGTGSTPASVAIKKIEFANSGMKVQVLWDATTDTVAAILPEGEGCLDFTTAPLQSSAGAGETGDIKFTTVGHAANDSYDVKLHLIKKYAA